MGTTDVGLVEFEEGGVGDIGTNITRLDSCFLINRVNSDQDALIVNIMNRNHNIIDTIIDVISYDDINHRLDIFIYGVWNFSDFKTKVLKDMTELLGEFGGQVEGLHLGICRVCGRIRLCFSGTLY